ncbi:MAG: LuxR family transcriptional regulator [Pseudomonadota bacterium]
MQDISAAQTKRALWTLLLDYFHDNGIAMVSYHAVKRDGTPFAIAADGFPEEWLCQYIEKDLVTIDPIPELAAKMSTPFFWHDIEALVDITPERRKYLDAMKDAHLGDGLAFFVFGPAMQNAYVGLGFGVDRIELEQAEIIKLQCIAQAGHLRVCALTEKHPSFQALTGREREILEWVAQGKSNSVIADIVGISSHTVDAHMRNIYRKLRVNDRTSAAVRGIGSGIVQYPG